MRTGLALTVAVAAALALPAAGSPSADPDCTGTYSTATPKVAKKSIRFGVDPGLAGSVGGVQLPSVPDNLAKDLAAVKALKPARKTVVIRLNRLFWSDGEAAVKQFKKTASTYTKAGFEVELQVRYHPPSGEAGDIVKWQRYVRHVVDVFGANRRVVAMTITNEVNVQFSPNTSDGYYKGAEDALIKGIETAHREAVKRRFKQLRFGFTYAYRFAPNEDAAFFAYLKAHGGKRFQKALGFVGLDFYPGSVYPPAMPPGDTYTHEFAQAAGVLRDCFAPQAGITNKTPIWITENGVPTGALSDTQQAAALTQLVQAAGAYSGTFNITDYRWFNLRDSSSGSPTNLIGTTFSSDGLLRSDYARKPSFGAYRALIAGLGAPSKRRAAVSSAVP